MSTSQLLWALPWLGLVLLIPLTRMRRIQLSQFPPAAAPDAPLVSIIVPARNEAANISVCLASLFNTFYPNYEIIVVDDGSTDGTEHIVRILSDHTDSRIQLVEGEPLPEGWLGKPWACWQGYQRATGELLLFTDADTRHDDDLLGHAVAALQQRKADLVSIFPRQLMVTFWERLVLPHIFSILMLRYNALDRINHTHNPKHVLANGQFVLIRRDAYDAAGGHEALRGEVVDDQRLAQRLVASGRRIFVAHAEDLMETRMYRSLGGIVEGWSKNLAIGSRQASPDWLGPAVPWLVALLIGAVWIYPPVTLLLAVTTPLAGPIQGWSLLVTLFSLLYWVITLALQRVPVQYALGYPIGATVAALLFIRSAVKGPRIAWKGREYVVRATSAAARPARSP